MKEARETVFVDELTDGILDPGKPMLGPVKNRGHIIANTAPGCWGPMITPAIKGGHEVTRPVFVEGAEVGDAIVIRIKSIQVTSRVTASGNEEALPERFVGDPFVAGKCPACGTLNPETVIEGIGEKAIKCKKCGAEVTPFIFTNGYTMAFDPRHRVGVTLSAEAAENVAREGKDFMALPDCSIQNPVVTMAPADIVALATRLRPFLGQLGTTPAMPMPDSHNAGDFGAFLVDAPHEYGVSAESLVKRTDGHMDVNMVREDAVLICPVKVPGGGVYLGDAHAMQGNGEIAGHTTDVAATVTLQVEVMKKFSIDGPVLLPRTEDLPHLARPLSAEERRLALTELKRWGIDRMEESLPICFVGTGPTLNEAIDNGLSRAAQVLHMPVPEVKNRATVSGSVDIGRSPGVVTVTFRAPVDNLRQAGLLELVQEMYP